MYYVYVHVYDDSDDADAGIASHTAKRSTTGRAGGLALPADSLGQPSIHPSIHAWRDGALALDVQLIDFKSSIYVYI